MDEYNLGISSKICTITRYMLETHSKVLLIRFDVRYPDGHSVDSPKNDDISKLVKSLKEWFRDAGIDMGYLWVREQNLSDLPHYHIALWVNGSRMQNGSQVLQFAAESWNRAIYHYGLGLIHHSSLSDGKSWHMLKRPSQAAAKIDWQMFQSEVDIMVDRLHYLAKTYTKDMAGYRVRNYSGSSVDVEEAGPMPIAITYPSSYLPF